MRSAACVMVISAVDIQAARIFHTDCMNVKRTQVERSEATRAALVRAGRALFGERGYGGVGTEEIVAHAGVTRGALYHHFADKRDLFRAVLEDLEDDVIARVGQQAAAT